MSWQHTWIEKNKYQIQYNSKDTSLNQIFSASMHHETMASIRISNNQLIFEIVESKTKNFNQSVCADSIESVENCKCRCHDSWLTANNIHFNIFTLFSATIFAPTAIYRRSRNEWHLIYFDEMKCWFLSLAGEFHLSVKRTINDFLLVAKAIRHMPFICFSFLFFPFYFFSVAQKRIAKAT